MKINEVIKTCRKQQKLTQEQIADYLGVTPPAVNKWEKGISYPDITLLAPLARLLNTDVNELLSFYDELTDMEINNIVEEISIQITEQGFKDIFEKSSGLIKKYPNCDKLILFLSQVLYAHLYMVEVENSLKYKKQLLSWFEIVAAGENKELANMAIIFLCRNSIDECKYEEAQKLLDRIPPLGIDKRVIQALLYIQQDNMEEAYQIHECILFQNANNVISSLMQIIQLKCRENNYEQALEYADMAQTVAETFELGRYIGLTPRFMVMMEKKDKNESLMLLKEMAEAIVEFNSVKNSHLYRHMKFKEDSGFQTMKSILKNGLENDKELEFIRDEPEFLQIINKLSKIEKDLKL